MKKLMSLIEIIKQKDNKFFIMENKLIKFYNDTGRNIGIQGEITGDGISENRLGLPRNTYQLHLFNIYDIDARKYVDFEEFTTIAAV